MNITITRTDVEDITGLIPTDTELDEIVRKLERDYRAQLFAGSLSIIAPAVVGSGTSLVRRKLRQIGVENFEEALFCATYEDIISVLEEEVASSPEYEQEALDWAGVLQAAVDAVRSANLYQPISEAVSGILYADDRFQS